MQKGRNRAFVGVFVILGSILAFYPATGAELISLRGIRLAPGSYVWGFRVNIRGARLLAVCRVPGGWSVQASNYPESGLYKNGGGEIVGGASVGHVAFDAAHLGELSRLFLIQPDKHAGAPRLDGSITVESFAEVGAGETSLTLTSEKFQHDPASHCP